jgi:hypothetical protein
MKTLLVTRFVAVSAVVPTLLSAQPVRDRVPLRHWPAPLYWQPDPILAGFRPLATVPSDPNPLAFIGMTPCRIVDTRAGTGFSGAFGPPSLTGGVSRTFPLQSSTMCSIPATAQAYSLNITVVPTGQLNYLSVWPTGQSQPNVSTLNDYTGTVVANAAIVPAGTSGSIDVYASNNTDIIIDINGYYAPQPGSARAYARWVFGTGLVPAQTLNITAVSSPSDGVYCLTPAAGIDPTKTVAFGAYAADGVPANNVGRPAFVDVVYGVHDCPAGQYEVVTGTPNPDGTLNIHALNGFAIVVP